jgi:hypothetical protein
MGFMDDKATSGMDYGYDGLNFDSLSQMTCISSMELINCNSRCSLLMMMPAIPLGENKY